MTAALITGRFGVRRAASVLAAMLVLACSGPALAAQEGDGYARLLARHVSAGRVDYAGMVRDRGEVLAIAAGFAAVEAQTERSWPRARRMAFWINAYNFFTLHAIVDHFPIRGSWFSRYPQNSIRQIDGAWTRLTWRVAGRQVSLDHIEHRILRPEFKDPRIHFAVNCASLGCPPLRGEPYRAGTLDAQLDDNARQFLASPHGLRVDGRTLAVTSILKWYGDDFVEQFARLAPGVRDPRQAAAVGVVATYGPPAAADLARSPGVRVRYLDYDWALNDTAASPEAPPR